MFVTLLPSTQLAALMAIHFPRFYTQYNTMKNLKLFVDVMKIMMLMMLMIANNG
jgi:hypothetical protein